MTSLSWLNYWTTKSPGAMLLYHSPIGKLTIQIKDGFISEIRFGENNRHSKNEPIQKLTGKDKKILGKCRRELDEYFSGKRKSFDLPLKQEGTEFQQKVWKELLKIPFGKTLSYLELSQKMGNVKAIRAVAAANGKNHLPVIVPCHRVIGSDGSLTGYGGGLGKKKWLLDHENKIANGVSLLF
jgi:methylated-DNA-[protein]-cysteine S-methyltransferase